MQTLKQPCIVKAVQKEQILGNQFKIREMLAITDEPGARQWLKFRFINTNVALLDDVFAGDRVVVDFTIAGREWFNPGSQQTEVFVSLEATALRHVAKVDRPEQQPLDEMPY